MRPGDLDARPPTRLDRPPRPESEIRQVRRERLAPRWTQWDYLHLDELRRALVGTFARLDADGPVLDLFCGTKPYLELMPWRPVWGLDLDRHFGRADVIGAIPLAFADEAFGVVVLTQALHLVDDPRATVAEVHRVLRPGGRVVITIPHLFLAEGEFERHWSAEHLRSLFADWDDVRIRGVGGPGAALAFTLGRIAMLGAGRWRIARALFTPFVLAVNVLGAAIDGLAPRLGRRWPQSLLLIARRSARGQPTP
jgi:SAM-dependent methyltransferase